MPDMYPEKATSPDSEPKSPGEEVEADRMHQPAAGRRLWRGWDLDSEESQREARRISLEIANSPTGKEDQDFVDAISWLNDNWEED
jgi:hypothetical protein